MLRVPVPHPAARAILPACALIPPSSVAEILAIMCHSYSSVDLTAGGIQFVDFRASHDFNL